LHIATHTLDPGVSPAGAPASNEAPTARFDDIRTGSGLELCGPVSQLVAEQADDVPRLLSELEGAVGSGAFAAGFLSYEAAPGLDPSLPVREKSPAEPFGSLPAAWFALFDSAREVPAVAAPGGPPRYFLTPFVPDMADSAYAARVSTVRAHIAAGDTYQCNLTTRLRAEATGDLDSWYADLARAQGGAYCAALDTGRYRVLSASPELFFEWTGGILTTRPMKGTAPRGRFPAEDEELAARLLASEKERSENLMIVDLLRNDVGRVAEWGSVEVPRLFELEPYPTVWQLTSTVSGRVRDGVRLADVFSALFPSGSVTGAPKRRTMQLIAELETSARGIYCGAVGLVAPPGHPFRARFGVPIRTVVVDRESGDVVYGSGSGITWGSDVAAEREEVRVKARILEPPPSELSLVETMAYSPAGGIRNLERHLERLGFSAGRLGFDLDEDAVQAALEEATVAAPGPRRVRLLLGRSGDVSVELGPVPERQRRPVRLALDLSPVDSGDLLLFHKTTRREPYTERLARHAEADDVLLVNEDGLVTESTISNLVALIDGRWWTPPIELGCLPGVERGRLLDEGTIAERALGITDVRGASRLGLVSSLRGWREACLS
jgi:para-aminobenzoate synthetase/4-amino-4-deoxychorismate lyase